MSNGNSGDASIGWGLDAVVRAASATSFNVKHFAIEYLGTGIMPLWPNVVAAISAACDMRDFSARAALIAAFDAAVREDSSTKNLAEPFEGSSDSDESEQVPRIERQPLRSGPVASLPTAAVAARGSSVTASSAAATAKAALAALPADASDIQIAEALRAALSPLGFAGRLLPPAADQTLLLSPMPPGDVQDADGAIGGSFHASSSCGCLRDLSPNAPCEAARAEALSTAT
jgi:hypothetical protein